MKSKKCKNKKGKQGFSSILVVTKSSFLRRFALMTKIVLLRTYFLGPKIKPGYIWGGGRQFVGVSLKKKMVLPYSDACNLHHDHGIHIEPLVGGYTRTRPGWGSAPLAHAKSTSCTQLLWILGIKLKKNKKASTPPKNGGNKMVFWDYLFRSTKKCN